MVQVKGPSRGGGSEHSLESLIYRLSAEVASDLGLTHGANESNTGSETRASIPDGEQQAQSLEDSTTRCFVRLEQHRPVELSGITQVSYNCAVGYRNC